MKTRQDRGQQLKDVHVVMEESKSRAIRAYMCSTRVCASIGDVSRACKGKRLGVMLISGRATARAILAGPSVVSDVKEPGRSGKNTCCGTRGLVVSWERIPLPKKDERRKASGSSVQARVTCAGASGNKGGECLWGQ